MIKNKENKLKGNKNSKIIVNNKDINKTNNKNKNKNKKFDLILKTQVNYQTIS